MWPVASMCFYSTPPFTPQLLDTCEAQQLHLLKEGLDDNAGGALSRCMSECSSSHAGSGGGGSTKSFKVLDISGMDIIFREKEWKHPEDPCAKSVVHLLERNESLVTWLQPRGGCVEDQIPAINVNGQYRTLSLRMQKSIWRHIRLKKGFVNMESLSQVKPKKAALRTGAKKSRFCAADKTASRRVGTSSRYPRYCSVRRSGPGTDFLRCQDLPTQLFAQYIHTRSLHASS